jgi:molybdopterin-biosynthesis enzyme MoeA-like protein
VSVAKAVGAEIEENEEALRLMKVRYPEKALTPERRLMARVPIGGRLIKNTVSGAPGFMIENVIVMAGVPKIMEVMLDDATQYLRTGAKLLSRNVVVEHPESSVASRLRLLDEEFESVSLGSYPYFKEGKVGTIVVLRGADGEALERATGALKAGLEEEGKTFREEDEAE